MRALLLRLHPYEYVPTCAGRCGTAGGDSVPFGEAFTMESSNKSSVVVKSARPAKVKVSLYQSGNAVITEVRDRPAANG